MNGSMLLTKTISKNKNHKQTHGFVWITFGVFVSDESEFVGINVK